MKWGKWGVVWYCWLSQAFFLVSYWILGFTSMGDAERVGFAVATVVGCAAGSLYDNLREFHEKRGK